MSQRFVQLLGLNYTQLDQVCQQNPAVCEDAYLWKRKGMQDFSLTSKVFKSVPIRTNRGKYEYLLTTAPNKGLLDAAKHDNVNLAKYYIGLGANNFINSLYIAAEHGSIEILELLSGYITSQEIASNIVVMAAEKNQEDITNYMIENFNVNPDYAIASAALEGNFALMERLDPSPEILTKVLDLALRSDRINIVNYLLSIGAKPRGDTIALATRMGNLDLFNRLLQASGYTLDEYLIWLVKNNKTDQIKFLLDNNLTDRDVVAALSNHESF